MFESTELAFIGKENLTSCLCVSEIESHVEREVSHLTCLDLFELFKILLLDTCKKKQLRQL